MTEETSTKLCRKCGETKPLTKEFWYQYKDRWQTPCKTCRSIQSQAHYAANAETMRARAKAYAAANAEKLYARRQAYYQANREELLAKKRVWREANAEELRAYFRAYHAAHREKRNAECRAYYAAHLEQCREYCRKWRAENAEYKQATDRAYHAANIEKARLRREANADRIRVQRRIWNSTNSEKTKPYRRNRKALLRGAEGTHTVKDVRRIYAEQAGKCAYCSVELHGEYHVDHVVPLSKGGSNYPTNLACACAWCNQSKNDRLLDEWIPVRGW